MKAHQNPEFVAKELSDISYQPNIITVMVDDLGWNQIGVDQATQATHPEAYVTPNLAKLAAGGLSFSHAYAQPNCAPTRAAMLSGQYPARIHNDVYVVSSLNRFGKGGLDKQSAQFTGPDQTDDVAVEAITVAEAMQKNGYATGHVGKYHVGGHSGEATLPENVGFDINIGGFKQGHQPVCFASEAKKGSWEFKGLGRGDFDRFGQPYTADYLSKYGFPESLEGTPKHVSDALADAMEESIQNLSSKNAPFYLQVHPYAVHGPVRSRPDLYKASGDDHLVGFVKSIDLIIGRLLAAVEDPNLDGDKSDSIAAETLILFTSDNGGTHRDNLPLRGKKGMLTEGGTRVPLIAYWPGIIPENTVSAQMVHSVDYYPTYLELAQKKWTPPVKEHPLDGFSFAEQLVHPQIENQREPIYFLFPGYLDTRAQPTVTAVGTVGGENYKLWYDYETDGWTLYAIDQSIDETENVIETQRDVA
ncbi:MAG: sulfatase-like hydrolase/transferase, partial [Verrucomicrobiota bacterium]